MLERLSWPGALCAAAVALVATAVLCSGAAGLSLYRVTPTTQSMSATVSSNAAIVRRQAVRPQPPAQIPNGCANAQPQTLRERRAKAASLPAAPEVTRHGCGGQSTEVAHRPWAWTAAVCSAIAAVGVAAMGLVRRRPQAPGDRIALMSANGDLTPGHRPRLVALDLDATVWYPEMFMLWGGGAPFVRRDDGALQDTAGRELRLMGSTRAIIRGLKTEPGWAGTALAYCSCTDEPAWAAECMRKFEVGDGMTLDSAADYKEIYKGRKVLHFQNIHAASGIAYEDMLFFDNENHNCVDVRALGVTCVHCPDGLTQGIWEQGLEQHADRAQRRRK